MTQAETNRGGRPKAYDELDLACRVRGIDDLLRIQDALEANNEPARFARSAAFYIGAVAQGDPTGGVSRPTATSYRAALARLPKDPLGGDRRRAIRRSSRGSAHMTLVGAGAAAGTLALAALTGPQGLNFALSLVSRAIADNAPYVKLHLEAPCDGAVEHRCGCQWRQQMAPSATWALPSRA